jgi:DNA modification methylase
LNIIRGDALHLPLRDESVDLIITSPPYFGLRDYSTGHPAEVGSEAHWREFIHALILATAEMVRALKPTGSIFVDLGDKYSTGNSGDRNNGLNERWGNATGRNAQLVSQRQSPRAEDMPTKSLMLLPERYRIACVDQLGLTARAVIVWDKPNGLPESVRDRVRRSHEEWVHLTRGPRYYAALDEIREPHNPNTLKFNPRYAHASAEHPDRVNSEKTEHARSGIEERYLNPLGKLPGSVWEIPSEPLRLPPWIDTQHYAAFPTEWPRRLILAFSPPGICVVCKVGRWPVVDRSREVTQRTATVNRPAGGLHEQRTDYSNSDRLRESATILGYACGCTPHTDHPERAAGRGFIPDPADKTAGASANGSERNKAYRDSLRNPPPPVREYHLEGWTPPPTTPATVLDPFGGTGTVAHVATALGRTGISIDLSEAYSRVAADRTLARQRAEKVLGRVHLERQGTLL